MFNKNRSFELEPPLRSGPNTLNGDMSIPPAPEPAPRQEANRPARTSNLSTLSAGVKYEGNISGAGELQVEGSLKGDIRVVQVSIGESGIVEGSIHADVLQVRGRVTGTIVAKQVHLFASARIEGDITQEQISIDKGAWFQGRCVQAKREQAQSQAQSQAPTPPEALSVAEKPALTTAKAEKA